VTDPAAGEWELVGVDPFAPDYHPTFTGSGFFARVPAAGQKLAWTPIESSSWEHVLVAPVLEAGATHRSVYLPTGTWYNWHTDEVLPGEQHVVAEAPLDRIPMYARAGAVVPMLPQAPSSTNGIHTETIELHVFVPDDGSDAVTSVLQEDDGLTWAALDGAFVRTEFTVCRDGEQLHIDAVASGNGFSEFRRGAFEIVLHGATPRVAVGAAGELPVDGQRVSVAAAGEGFTVTLTV